MECPKPHLFGLFGSLVIIISRLSYKLTATGVFCVDSDHYLLLDTFNIATQTKSMNQKHASK